MSTIIYR